MMQLNSKRSPVFSIAGVCLALFAVAQVHGATVVLQARNDNTLIEDSKGSLSNGVGGAVYVGKVGSFGGNTIRRGVIAFDVSSIPAGVTIQSASLSLNLLHSVSGDATISMHRLLASWGEGVSSSDGGQGAPSETDDATWIHRFYPEILWTNPGGDYAATATASQIVGSAQGAYVWSSPGMIADVSAWVNDSASNFGWIIIGNEAAPQTAKQFASRNNKTEAIRPTLTITYSTPCPADINHDSQVNVSDLLAIINAWGACAAPCPPNCPADIVHDCVVNVSDLLAVINGWGTCPP